MVQVLERQPSKWERLIGSLTGAAQDITGGAGEFKHALNLRDERQELAKRFGDEFKNYRSPDIQKLMVHGELEKRNQAEKIRGEYEADEQSYDKIKNAFGEKFADIWRASPTGARTALTQAALDARARGLDLEEILGKTQRDQPRPPEDLKQEPSPYKLNTEGMTPKEIVEYQGVLRKENMPIWKDNTESLKDANELDRDISILNKINEKKNLPEGLEKLLIDPETGAPYPLGTLIKSPSRDVQQWAKTIARQATKARSAFPGRVTNFDLAAYMRQFPGLFNTYEGRKIILDQMRLTNKANLILAKALDKVYSKNKLSGITPEDAFDEARKKVSKELESIDKQLIELADEGEILNEPKEDLSGRLVDVIGPDGKLYEVDESEVGMLPEGYRIK